MQTRVSFEHNGTAELRTYMYTVYSYFYIYIYTSSAAQGGGGSFKNTKPIGRVGCCDSRMAERIHLWTERWLELFSRVVAMVAVVPHHNCWM